MGTLKGGYIIPASPLPEDDYCLRVYIPANTEYLIQFFTALGYFGKWNSWKRLHDGSNLEKQVADRWKVSIEKTHEAWSEGGCEMFQLRQSSTDPCILEQSIDGGATWSTAFDYSRCQNVITVPAPYPGSETGASDAAAAAVKNIFQALVNLIDCGTQTRAQYIEAATAYMRTYDASYANPAALGAIYDAYCADPSAGDDYKTDCPWIDHKNDIEGCTGSDGLMDWLNCLSDTIIDWLNTSSDALMDALNQAAAALSGNGWQNAGAGGAGGGAGFGAGCDPCQPQIDFTIEDGGFTAVNTGFDPSHTYGEWIDGTGWQTTFDPSWGHAVNIQNSSILPSGCTIVRIEVDVMYNNDYYPFFKLYGPTGGYEFINEYNAGHGTGLYTYVWTGSREFTDIGIYQYCSNGAAPENQIKAIRFYTA